MSAHGWTGRANCSRPRMRSIPGRSWPSAVEAGLSSNAFGPELAQSGPIGPVPARFGRLRSSASQGLATICHTRDRSLREFDTGRPKFSQAWPELGQILEISASVGPRLEDVGPHPKNLCWGGERTPRGRPGLSTDSHSKGRGKRSVVTRIARGLRHVCHPGGCRFGLTCTPLKPTTTQRALPGCVCHARWPIAQSRECAAEAEG